MPTWAESDFQAQDVFKAYIMVVYVSILNVPFEYVEERLNAARTLFSREKFEDHLNAPCMVIVVASQDAQSRIEFHEFYPESNISFKTFHNDFNDGKFQELKDLQEFLATLRNPNE